jgi:hypothetical protein
VSQWAEWGGGAISALQAAIGCQPQELSSWQLVRCLYTATSEQELDSSVVQYIQGGARLLLQCCGGFLCWGVR